MKTHALCVLTLSMLLWMPLTGCGGGDEGGGGDRAAQGHNGGGGRPGGGAGGRPGAPGGVGPGAASPAIPVEVVTVERRPIAAYLETNGTLEAENEVDLVARMAGPIVQLSVEEGRQVKAGTLLAKIDDAEIRAQMEVARVDLQEAQLAYERAQQLHRDGLISLEEFERTRAVFETSRAQLQGNEVELSFTEIRAPFDGLVIRRYIKFAEYVTNGSPLFRISDFQPLLCPIRVPERELQRLAVGQSAFVTVEAWRGDRFPARVLRIRPVVEADTGTVEVTLEVDGGGKLRPGMFASVFLEVDRRADALVIPKAALVLESLGDTVFLVEAGTGAGTGGGQIAVRRDIELGFEERDAVEVRTGLQEGEKVVVLGQSGLSDGTPVRILGGAAATAPRGDTRPEGASPGAASGTGGPPGPGGRGGGGFDPSQMTEEQLERVKARMRERGLTDEQIEERLGQMRQRAGGGGR
jgi:membrane fusion protein, multidrug efflux system